jgi:hypothetical protein
MPRATSAVAAGADALAGAAFARARGVDLARSTCLSDGTYARDLVVGRGDGARVAAPLALRLRVRRPDDTVVTDVRPVAGTLARPGPRARPRSNGALQLTLESGYASAAPRLW